MERKPIQTKNAPAAIGPYEQAIRAGDFLFSSGQISMDPATGEMISGEIEEETERVLKNLEAILSAAGFTLQQVIRTTVYLTDLGHFARMNEVYAKFFSEKKPAQSCVQVAALPKGAKIEIDLIAAATRTL